MARPARVPIEDILALDDQGLSLSEIGRRLGMTPAAVLYRLAYAGRGKNAARHVEQARERARKSNEAVAARKAAARAKWLALAQEAAA